MLLLSALSGKGQDDVTTAEGLAAQRKLELDQFPHNIQAGDLRLDLSQSMAVEYNDNLALTSSDRQTDTILRPILHADALYPVGDLNRLKLNLGVGYEKYLSHSDYDRAVISPDSELTFDMFVKESHIELHDRFSYELDPGRLAAISGTASYGGFDNISGASIETHFKDVVTTVSYDFDKFISDVKEFNYTSRQTHIAQIRAGYPIEPEFTTGIELAVIPTSYDPYDDPRNIHHLPLVSDNIGYEAGVYAIWQVSEHLLIQPRVGYSYYTFSDSLLNPNGAPGLGSYYFNVHAQHQLNSKIGYNLDASKQTQNGAYGNILDSYRVSFDPWLRTFYNSYIDSVISFESGDEKYGAVTDNFERWVLSLGVRHDISKKLSARIEYRIVIKSSIFSSRDYNQDRVDLNLTYHF